MCYDAFIYLMTIGNSPLPYPYSLPSHFPLSLLRFLYFPFLSLPSSPYLFPLSPSSTPNLLPFFPFSDPALPSHNISPNGLLFPSLLSSLLSEPPPSRPSFLLSPLTTSFPLSPLPIRSSFPLSPLPNPPLPSHNISPPVLPSPFPSPFSQYFHSPFPSHNLLSPFPSPHPLTLATPKARPTLPPLSPHPPQPPPPHPLPTPHATLSSD